MAADSILHSTLSNGVPGGAEPTPVLSYPPPDHTRTYGKEDFRCFSCLPTPEVSSNYVSFSAKTCLELLPLLTPEQLDYEFKFCKSLGLEFNLRSLRKLSPESLVGALKNKYIDQVYLDMNTLVDKVDQDKPMTLISNISRLIEDAEKLRSQLLNINTNATHSTGITVTQNTHAECSHTQDSTHSLPTPVCTLDNLYFAKVNTDDISSHFPDILFNVVGNRKTAYFGEHDYTYGNITHAKCKYPANTVIDTIFTTLSEELKLPDFNKEEYTCLITLYENGDSFIPYHSDNERCIVPNSNIITVSLGAQRDIVFRSILGMRSNTHCPTGL